MPLYFHTEKTWRGNGKETDNDMESVILLAKHRDFPYKTLDYI